ncbi:hypothetical protein ONO23_03780 [Micromonospora noduli]|nr:hypothetical protein ONO23_03780 [Micromonospora noduli]
MTVTFWADPDVIHLLIAGSRIKTIRSHLSVADLAVLLRQGGRPAGSSPLPLDTAGRPGVVEVDRTVKRDGKVSLGQHVVLAAEILAGRRVGVRIDPTTLAFFDPETRQLLRTRPNPLTPEQIMGFRGARPAGPPPAALDRTGPGPTPRLQQRRGHGRLAESRSRPRPCRQDRDHHLSDTEPAVECDNGLRTIRRSNDHPLTRTKAHRPRKVALDV